MPGFRVVTEECLFVCSCLFFSAGLLKLNFNDTREQRTYFSSEQFQLGRRRNHARPGQRKFPCPRQESNSQPSGSVVGTSDKHVVFGGSWVQFSRRVRKFSLSRASMISPPSKLKMFTGSVCVLLTSVSLKLTKIKIKLIYATTSSWGKKQNGGWKLSDTDWFYFSFYNPSCLFFMIRVDPSPILFYFYFFIRSELVRVDPSWSDPDWRSELIRSDFCTCLISDVIVFVFHLA